MSHVDDAEIAYARKLGIRRSAGSPASSGELRRAIVAALREARTAPPPIDTGWPARYAARRIAWHVLDHAWEIEDRTER